MELREKEEQNKENHNDHLIKKMTKIRDAY